jgi:hypothetical protein
MKDIFIARKAFEACLISSALFTPVTINLATWFFGPASESVRL